MTLNFEELQKITNTISQIKERMNLESIEIGFDSNKNAIVMAEKGENSIVPEKNWAVWTLYNTGEFKTSYSGFNSGDYDLSYENAKSIFENRIKK